MSKRRAKIEAAIERLAGLFEYGALMSSMSPAALLDTASDEIERLREIETRFELDRAGIERREAEAVELVELRRARDFAVRQAQKSQAENERLRAELAKWQRDYVSGDPAYDKGFADGLAFPREVER